jgi:hypothetical protein
MWITDPKSKEKSVTVTFFTFGFIVALGKLFVSGATVYGFTFGTFTGGEFATVMAALGGVYWARKNTDVKAEK